MIKGKVQGVFYRATAKEKAIELVITGWIKNTTEGHVESVVSGEEEAIQQFVQWCNSGPKGASVTAMEKTIVEEKSYANFSITR